VEAKQFCYGFLAGVAQFHGAMVQGDKIQPLACPKDAVTREQLVGVFLDWAKANPQSMDELPVESLERAAVSAQPGVAREAVEGVAGSSAARPLRLIEVQTCRAK
jgi:Rap1a immunity proteins